MSTTSIGRQAEQVCVEYLRQHGFQVLQQNWRTKYCEIDIIALKKGTIYFIEVKYRQHAAHGTGLDYITPRKLRQMRFAAELWVSEQSWNGQYNLAAVEVSGSDFKIGRLVDGFL